MKTVLGLLMFFAGFFILLLLNSYSRVFGEYIEKGFNFKNLNVTKKERIACISIFCLFAVNFLALFAIIIMSENE